MKNPLGLTLGGKKTKNSRANSVKWGKAKITIKNIVQLILGNTVKRLYYLDKP